MKKILWVLMTVWSFSSFACVTNDNGLATLIKGEGNNYFCHLTENGKGRAKISPMSEKFLKTLQAWNGTMIRCELKNKIYLLTSKESLEEATEKNTTLNVYGDPYCIQSN